MSRNLRHGIDTETVGRAAVVEDVGATVDDVVAVVVVVLGGCGVGGVALDCVVGFWVFAVELVLQGGFANTIIKIN